MRAGVCQGFTLIEALVALVLLALVTGVYIHAQVASTTQQTQLTSNEVATANLALIAREINRGNSAAMQPQLSPQAILSLESGTDQQLLSSTFSATVTFVPNSDPPQYLIAVRDRAGNGVSGTAVAPGGQP
ncbi:prepilin-type N-terminal cleavage/methylation domain-containing protein [Deinococcus ruber]|uniref:Prepilin-type N-terminal cleavage/methylation domain-containing protein n=1 Tax=Deinococcus ruber TaxID=1848197 RepID=A0A918C9B9_9DEIO|nr:prepilin-type N-terminal cleavage/methylation domain-containing protein [Deinococcus ruber]GGR09996.1 hypothetical protein GCM10008957_23470 [Deinococcus ruber]